MLGGKEMKKKIIVMVIFLTVLFGISAITFTNTKKTNNEEVISAEKNDTVEEVETTNDDSKNNEIKENEEEKETPKESTEEVKTTKEETKTTQTTTNSQETNKNSSNNNANTNNNSSSNTQNNKQSVETKTAWEELGISEYDYYHKPMWSWARIDYSVETYGSYEKAHQACIDAGSSLENIISFSCSSINSYSGDYLGEMLKVKEG